MCISVCIPFHCCCDGVLRAPNSSRSLPRPRIPRPPQLPLPPLAVGDRVLIPARQWVLDKDPTIKFVRYSVGDGPSYETGEELSEVCLLLRPGGDVPVGCISKCGSDRVCVHMRIIQETALGQSR